MSRKQLAEEIGYSEAAISLMCINQRKPRIESLELMSNVFGVTVEDMTEMARIFEAIQKYEGQYLMSHPTQYHGRKRHPKIS